MIFLFRIKFEENFSDTSFIQWQISLDSENAKRFVSKWSIKRGKSEKNHLFLIKKIN